jgi:hypothetical protein
MERKVQTIFLRTKHIDFVGVATFGEMPNQKQDFNWTLYFDNFRFGICISFSI